MLHGQGRITLKTTRLTVAMSLTLLIVGIFSLFVGALDIDPVRLLAQDAIQLQTLMLSRVPRLLAILATGAGMSVAGLIMQQLCQNRFVSPTTGATISAAQLGVLLSLALLPTLGLAGRAALAFGCAAAATLAFVHFVQRIRFKDATLVPLVGIMFGNIISGITSFLSFQFGLTQAMATWTVGHFSLVVQGNYELIWLAGPMIVLAFVFARHFNIVGLGRDFSHNLGVNYDRILLAGLCICSAITASVVVTVGSISYIGLVIPNIITLIKGDNVRGNLVDTALLGSLFVLICDLIARTIIAPYEMPIEFISGIVGSVVFIAMLFARLRHEVGARAHQRLRTHAGTAQDPVCAADSPNTPAEQKACPQAPSPFSSAQEGTHA